MIIVAFACMIFRHCVSCHGSCQFGLQLRWLGRAAVVSRPMSLMHRREAKGGWLQSPCRNRRPPGRAVQLCDWSTSLPGQVLSESSKAVSVLVVQTGLHSPAAAMLAHCDSLSSTSPPDSLPHVCRHDVHQKISRSLALASTVLGDPRQQRFENSGHRTLCCDMVTKPFQCLQHRQAPTLQEART